MTRTGFLFPVQCAAHRCVRFLTSTSSRPWNGGGDGCVKPPDSIVVLLAVEQKGAESGAVTRGAIRLFEVVPHDKVAGRGYARRQRPAAEFPATASEYGSSLSRGEGRGAVKMFHRRLERDIQWDEATVTAAHRLHTDTGFEGVDEIGQRDGIDAGHDLGDVERSGRSGPIFESDHADRCPSVALRALPISGDRPSTPTTAPIGGLGPAGDHRPRRTAPFSVERITASTYPAPARPATVDVRSVTEPVRGLRPRHHRGAGRPRLGPHRGGDLPDVDHLRRDHIAVVSSWWMRRSRRWGLTSRSLRSQEARSAAAV